MEASEKVDSDGIEGKKHSKISEVKNSFLLCARRDGYRNNGKSSENKPNRRYRMAERTRYLHGSMCNGLGFLHFLFYTYTCTHLFIFQVQSSSSSSSDGVGGGVDDDGGTSSSSSF